jgi:hypothetical protein
LTVLIAGCSGSGDSGRAVTPPPSRAGTVWEADSAENRANSAATMLAYANGLHVIVVDGDDVFAGMTRLHSEAAPGGGRSIKLDGGLTAELVPAGDALQLRFSSGDTVRMRKRETAE